MLSRFAWASRDISWASAWQTLYTSPHAVFDDGNSSNPCIASSSWTCSSLSAALIVLHAFKIIYGIWPTQLTLSSRKLNGKNPKKIARLIRKMFWKMQGTALAAYTAIECPCGTRARDIPFCLNCCSGGDHTTLHLYSQLSWCHCLYKTSLLSSTQKDLFVCLYWEYVTLHVYEAFCDRYSLLRPWLAKYISSLALAHLWFHTSSNANESA